LQDFVLQWKETFPPVSFAVVAFHILINRKNTSGMAYRFMRQVERQEWHAEIDYVDESIIGIATYCRREKGSYHFLFPHRSDLHSSIIFRLTGVPFIAIAAGQDVKSSNPIFKSHGLRRRASSPLPKGCQANWKNRLAEKQATFPFRHKKIC
jgi:hypothetical protein